MGRAMPPSQPPTQRQLDFIADLSRQTRVPYVAPETRAAAKLRIEHLTALRRRQQT